MVFLLRFFLIFSFLFSFGILMSAGGCKTQAEKRLGDGLTTIDSEEGWVNDNVYKMQVYGQWDRNRYYIEDDDEEEGKSPKPFYGLREDAKTAAKVRAMRNFKEKMISYIRSESKVENQALISDTIDAALSGITVSPQAIKESYSKRHDAIILFHFEAKGLKKIIDKAALETLKNTNE